MFYNSVLQLYSINNRNVKNKTSLQVLWKFYVIEQIKVKSLTPFIGISHLCYSLTLQTTAVKSSNSGLVSRVSKYSQTTSPRAHIGKMASKAFAFSSFRVYLVGEIVCVLECRVWRRHGYAYSTERWSYPRCILYALKSTYERTDTTIQCSMHGLVGTTL